MTIPLPVLLSAAIAAALCSLELVGWFILCPRFARLLPFERPAPPDLPAPQRPMSDEPARGRGDHVTWRWHPASRALLFRRRITLGRKPYCMGRLHLDHHGRWRLHWAPIPFFSWPAAGAAWIAWLLGAGWVASPGSNTIMAVTAAMFVAVVLANLFLSRLAFDRVVWPELEEHVREWLG